MDIRVAVSRRRVGPVGAGLPSSKQSRDKPVCWAPCWAPCMHLKCDFAGRFVMGEHLHKEATGGCTVQPSVSSRFCFGADRRDCKSRDAQTQQPARCALWKHLHVEFAGSRGGLNPGRDRQPAQSFWRSGRQPPTTLGLLFSGFSGHRSLGDCCKFGSPSPPIPGTIMTDVVRNLLRSMGDEGDCVQPPRGPALGPPTALALATPRRLRPAAAPGPPGSSQQLVTTSHRSGRQPARSPRAPDLNMGDAPVCSICRCQHSQDSQRRTAASCSQL